MSWASISASRGCRFVEGDGTKLQFAGPNCVLDVYLYPNPSGAGVPRVTHVDARNFQGSQVNAQNCIASIEAH